MEGSLRVPFIIRWPGHVPAGETFTDRPGGYTRVLRLAQPRLGDAGTRAILEFVGVRDRVVERSVRPTFEGDTPSTPATGKKKAAKA